MEALLRKGLAALDICANDAQLQQVLQWVGLLEKWNRAYNLTAVRKPGDIITHLVLDSLVLLPFLRGRKVLDLGSGAGVPGIPLALLDPKRRYTLLDSNGKKTRFLEHCRMQMQLENVEVERSRAEAFSPGAGFDTIVTRAFGKLTNFIAATSCLGRPGTLWLTLKSGVVQAEVGALQRDWVEWEVKYSIEQVQAPSSGRATALVCIEMGP